MAECAQKSVPVSILHDSSFSYDLLSVRARHDLSGSYAADEARAADEELEANV